MTQHALAEQSLIHKPDLAYAAQKLVFEPAMLIRSGISLDSSKLNRYLLGCLVVLDATAPTPP